MEIYFNNLPELWFIQHRRFNVIVVNMEFASYAVDRWSPYWSYISEGIPGIAKSVLTVFLNNPIASYHTTEVC